MSYGELTLPQSYTGRNAQNGRFLKGHKAYNKGKTWDEFMGKRAQKRCMKGWRNLENRRGKRSEECGRAKKQVVAIAEDGAWFVFPSTVEAGARLMLNKHNIARCCRQNQAGTKTKSGGTNTSHKYGGFFFYFESDEKWMKKIKEE